MTCIYTWNFKSDVFGNNVSFRHTFISRKKIRFQFVSVYCLFPPIFTTHKFTPIYKCTYNIDVFIQNGTYSLVKLLYFAKRDISSLCITTYTVNNGPSGKILLLRFLFYVYCIRDTNSDGSVSERLILTESKSYMKCFYFYPPSSHYDWVFLIFQNQKQ